MSKRIAVLVPWLLVSPIFVAAWFGLFACHGPRADASRGPVELVYEFERVPDGVRISASARGAAGDTEWTLPVSWGGNDAPDSDLGTLSAEDGGGRPLALAQKAPNAWVVHADREGLQSVRYTLAPTEHLASKVHTDHYRPIVSPELFHVLGGRALLTPSSLPRERDVRVRLQWRGFDRPGENVATSFGCGERELEFVARLDDLQHAVYLAGEFALERREVRGEPVDVAVHGKRWPTPAAEFADVAARIVETERAFFDDWDYPHYLISLVEAGPDEGGSQSIGGTGLHDSFAMFVSPGAPLAPSEASKASAASKSGDAGNAGNADAKRVLHVLAHEMFHHWCGGAITPEAPEELSYWFTEGFTDYFTRRLLHRAGLYGPEDFAANLNEKLAGYYGSAVREAPAERIREDFWNDSAVSMLPYQRGDALAIELDWAIRRASAGARTIDDWIRAEFRGARERGRPFTRDELFASIAAVAGPETAELLRAVAQDGKLLPPRADWFEPCMTHAVAQSGVFDLGFDFEATRTGNVVTGLRAGSAAERAGLREGDRLGGWSVSFGDAGRPVELTVLDGATARKLEYLPCVDPREVPSFRPVGGADCGPRSGV
ncbi:MAG: hypothetical protein HZA52_18990 [Planctomycetes bacterium]|nr:hypothetical protein [Planctomycetota bacterium]